MARKISIEKGEIRTTGYRDQQDIRPKEATEEMHEFCALLDRHIVKAERKHPLFTNILNDTDSCLDAFKFAEMIAREKYEYEFKHGKCHWFSILNCEILEAQTAIKVGDWKAAIDELMDCAAVIYRQVAVVRELARREEEGGAE